MKLTQVPLPRTAKLKMVGKDIDAHGQALHRYLKTGQLDEFLKSGTMWRQTFGTGKQSLAKKAAAKANLPQYGVIGPELYHAMVLAGAYIGQPNKLLIEYMTPKMPKMVYPHDMDFHSRTGMWIHQTGGIGGNYALDFMAAPGTPVLAVESGTISRVSGYDPRTGLHGAVRDVFGWSIYNKRADGFYYSTHYGTLEVRAGDKVEAGDILGVVGNWPGDTPRSHTHYGFTHITRLSYLSKKRILAVAKSPRVEGRHR